MKAHRIETTITENGTLHLKNLPFKSGETVEIIVLERNSQPPNSNPYPLRGKVIRYEDPFEPATSLEDWEALK
ncbi:MAG: hypothetical protein SAJ37_00345 [Oscillatoria sp. PMC 1068.18]|nr:hypothetical protein [Oscillatoria sp. PMC 1076.18]MEC4987170.1 hypothetical protein [Oscillatoria sp. PMC 1068.18]